MDANVEFIKRLKEFKRDIDQKELEFIHKFDELEEFFRKDPYTAKSDSDEIVRAFVKIKDVLDKNIELAENNSISTKE